MRRRLYCRSRSGKFFNLSDANTAKKCDCINLRLFFTSVEVERVDDRYRSDRIADRTHSLVELVLNLHTQTIFISLHKPHQTNCTFCTLKILLYNRQLAGFYQRRFVVFSLPNKNMKLKFSFNCVKIRSNFKMEKKIKE